MRNTFSDIRPVSQTKKNTPPKTAEVASAKKIPILKKKETTQTEKQVPVQISQKPQEQVYVPPIKIEGSLPRIQKSPRAFIVWLLCLGICAGLVAYAGYFFRIAQITITPKTIAGHIDTHISAEKSSRTSMVLPFETMTIKGSLTKTVLATDTKEVSESARGQVIFYNKYSATPRLVAKDTRLTATNGVLYKLENTITIPGYTKTKNVITPGSISATVIASEPGEKGNSGPTDFSVVAFKGKDTYTKIYARSTGALTGGYVGTSFIASQDLIEKTKTILSEELKQKLIQDAGKQLPKGYYLPNNLFVFSVTITTPDQKSDRASLSLVADGQLTAVIIPEKQLTYTLAHLVASEITEETKLEKPDMHTVTIAFDSKFNTESIDTVKSIPLTITGDIQTNYTIDIEKITKAITGIEQSAFTSTLAKEVGVGTASLKMIPWYASTLPQKSSRIHTVLK